MNFRLGYRSRYPFTFIMGILSRRKLSRFSKIEAPLNNFGKSASSTVISN